MILLEYQNIKIILQKVALQIDLKKIVIIKKVKHTVQWTHAIDALNGEEIVGTFYEKELQKSKRI